VIARPLLVARARYLALRLGWPGALGLLALLAALATWFGAGQWLERDARERAARMATAQERLVLQSDPKAALRARDPLAAFVASLPPGAQVPDLATELQRRAERDAVEIERTEYRVQPVLGRNAQRIRLHFPAHADYPHLRVWLEGLLHDYPSLSLDEISLHRAVEGGEELDASIGLSFLAREAP
jgi:hypothetical protein